MIVLEKIRDIRKKKGISQKKMSELLNISQPGYQKIEKGDNVLSVDRFLQICKILNVESYNELLPEVSIDIKEKILLAFMAGQNALGNIKQNAMYGRRLADGLIEKVKTDSLTKVETIEELGNIEAFLDVIQRLSFIHDNDYHSIIELIQKFD